MSGAPERCVCGHSSEYHDGDEGEGACFVVNTMPCRCRAFAASAVAASGAASLDAAFTEEHETWIAEACEKLWNGEPARNPIHSPRPKDHPLVAYANRAHEALNAALTLRVQYYKMRGELAALREERDGLLRKCDGLESDIESWNKWADRTTDALTKRQMLSRAAARDPEGGT